MLWKCSRIFIYLVRNFVGEAQTRCKNHVEPTHLLHPHYILVLCVFFIIDRRWKSFTAAQPSHQVLHLLLLVNKLYVNLIISTNRRPWTCAMFKIYITKPLPIVKDLLSLNLVCKGHITALKHYKGNLFQSLQVHGYKAKPTMALGFLGVLLKDKSNTYDTSIWPDVKLTLFRTTKSLTT